MGILHHLPRVADGHNLLAKMLSLKITASQINTPQRTAKDFQDIWNYTLSKRANHTVPRQLQTKTQLSQPCSPIDFLPFGEGGHEL